MQMMEKQHIGDSSYPIGDRKNRYIFFWTASPIIMMMMMMMMMMTMEERKIKIMISLPHPAVNA